MMSKSAGGDDRLFNSPLPKIGYFTMEIGLEPGMHSYSGGLGILAGDTVRSFADLDVPAVAVTQLNDMGYCYQELDDDGNQRSSPDPTQKAVQASA